MRTQTKCTLAICGLLIIEMLPMPVSSIYSLYVVRKRPGWLPNVVDRLYADKPDHEGMAISHFMPAGHDPLETRKKCTIILTVLFVVDLLIPVIIPASLFVVRRRPLWFKNLVAKLYSDRSATVAIQSNTGFEPKMETPEFAAALDKRFAELERKNLDFAKSLTKNTIIKLNTATHNRKHQ